jgi:hypothetical protein
VLLELGALGSGGTPLQSDQIGPHAVQHALADASFALDLFFAGTERIAE